MAQVGKSIASFASTGTGSGDFDFSKLTEQDLDSMIDLYRKVALVAVVEPKISQAPGPDEIDILLVPFEDLQIIFPRAIRQGAINYAPFRGKAKPGAHARSGSQKVRAAAKLDDRNNGAGAALDFDFTIMLLADRLEKGEPVDRESYREKWENAFAQLQGMQVQVVETYKKQAKNGRQSGSEKSSG